MSLTKRLGIMRAISIECAKDTALGNQVLIDALTNPRGVRMQEQRRQTAAPVSWPQQAVLVFTEDFRLVACHPDAGEFSEAIEPGRILPQGCGWDALMELLEVARNTGSSASGNLQWPDHQVRDALIKPMADGGFMAILQAQEQAGSLKRSDIDFLSTASHELKNPISNILGFSEILSKVGPLNEKQQQYVRHICSAADKMNYLVQNLLDLAMMKGGNHVEAEIVDVNAQLSEIADEFRAQAQSKNQTLQFEAATETPTIHADPIQVRRALHNLVGNALKYTPANGAILLSVISGKDDVTIRVKDNGPGIPEEALPLIFEPFYRVKNKDTRGIEGNGLGLAIVKSIIEQHGGQVTVQSEVGRGSCFTLTLPLKNPDHDATS